jgi:HK97 family phage major capsid protein/HK97 family phage prohead protease
MTETIKVPSLARDLPAASIELRAEKGVTRLTFPASSEQPVERWFGEEVLSHAKGAVRMDRVDRGALPLLFNHNWDDPIGIVDGARLEGGRLVVDAHLFDTARAQEVGAMLSGGLRNVSLGYRLHVVEEDKKRNVFTATDWEPYEVSIVTVPADPTVGLGRQAADSDGFEVRMVRAAEVKPAAVAAPTEDTMSNVQNAAAGAVAEPKATESPKPEKFSATQIEEKRKAAIVNLCRANKIDERIERQWIETGADMNEVADGIVEVLAERGKNSRHAVTRLDLSAADTKRYSLMRALRAASNKSWDKAGFELECNKEISNRLHRLPRAETSFFVPLDVLMAELPGRRDMTVAGVSGSNYLVSTDNQPGSFIDLLRNTSVALRMGITRLSGLVGNVTIPKMTAGNSAYWLADETTQITESQPTLGQLSLAPKNVAALTELSHQLMQQSTPDAESLVLSSIARDIALAVDVGVLRGSGASGQPTGIVNTAGIGSVTGTSLAAAGILEFQADVAAANALLPGCGYVTTPAVAALLMARPELPSTGTERLWRGSMLMGSLFDMPAMSSAQMSAATMLFGYWPGVILAEWGVLELMTNPFSDFTRGLTAVRGWYTCDVGVRYPGGFSYASSIT